MKKIYQSTTARQFIKFALVGTFNTGVDWVFFIIFKTGFGLTSQLGKQIAKGGSFCVSASSSYVMNRRWTFRSTDPNLKKQALKFFLVSVTGLCINNSVFFLCTSVNHLNLPDLYGLVCATGVAMFWNFFANKYWTFNHNPE